MVRGTVVQYGVLSTTVYHRTVVTACVPVFPDHVHAYLSRFSGTDWTLGVGPKP